MKRGGDGSATRSGAQGSVHDAARRAWRTGLCVALAVLLGGCETLAYYGQAVGGQFELVALARPVREVQADPATPPELRAQLALAARLRDFASGALDLPDNGSYRRYVELGRPYVVWNVFAAREFSVETEQSCFPVAGCVSYRGFFAREAAERHAAGLRAQGLDAHVGGVPAYSTLGWFDDPLLSSFIRYPETELARLLFHELAHQRFYLKGDTAFNESFATAVERAGVQRWLQAQGRAGEMEAFLRRRARQSEFLALVEAAKSGLARLYAKRLAPEAMRAEKRAAFDALRREVAALETRWGDAWLAAAYARLLGETPNNALLASISAYARHVPAFERLLAEAGGDLPKFYAEVERIAALPKAERCAALGVAAPPAGGARPGLSSAAC